MRRDERCARRASGSRVVQGENVRRVQALCPPGSEPNASYRMVTTYWEMVASFYSGVLNAELFYQSGREMLFVWERVRDIVPTPRASSTRAS